MAEKARFTRIPKVTQLTSMGVPTEAIPTYCALTDYANNKTGLCFPKMETLASTLKRSVRTIQRHIHLLVRLGLIELLERRRYKGRFSSYLYRVLHIAATTGHARPSKKRSPIKRRTKREMNTPISPQKKKEEEARRRREGYEWLFDR